MKRTNEREFDKNLESCISIYRMSMTSCINKYIQCCLSKDLFFVFWFFLDFLPTAGMVIKVCVCVLQVFVPRCSIVLCDGSDRLVASEARSRLNVS